MYGNKIIEWILTHYDFFHVSFFWFRSSDPPLVFVFYNGSLSLLPQSLILLVNNKTPQSLQRYDDNNLDFWSLCFGLDHNRKLWPSAENFLVRLGWSQTRKHVLDILFRWLNALMTVLVWWARKSCQGRFLLTFCLRFCLHIKIESIQEKHMQRKNLLQKTHKFQRSMKTHSTVECINRNKKETGHVPYQFN